MVDRAFLDWPFFDDSHRRLAFELEDWCASNLTGERDDADVDTACRILVRQLGQAGWLRYCVPAAHGGVHEQLDVRSLALIRETLARHDGLADFAFAMQGLGSGTITLFGTDEQKRAYLPAVARGEKIAAFALTDPGSGSDVANMESAATEQDGGYTLSGGKTYISNGGIADFYVLFARTGQAPGAKGISAFLVDSDAPGVPSRAEAGRAMSSNRSVASGCGAITRMRSATSRPGASESTRKAEMPFAPGAWPVRANST
jgi:acyl-CoA dehydrogenase